VGVGPSLGIPSVIDQKS